MCLTLIVILIIYFRMTLDLTERDSEEYIKTEKAKFKSNSCGNLQMLSQTKMDKEKTCHSVVNSGDSAFIKKDDFKLLPKKSSSCCCVQIEPMNPLPRSFTWENIKSI